MGDPPRPAARPAGGGPLHALELLPDAAGQAAVRRDWQALRDAGLRSQLDHRGATNAPHLTLVAAPALGPDVNRAAVELLAPALPVRVRTSGLLLLGGRRVTVARAVEVADDVVRAILALRATVPDQRHPTWLPHLTLARRLPREDVPRALDALDPTEVVLELVELRRWDPEEATAVALAGLRNRDARRSPV